MRKVRRIVLKNAHNLRDLGGYATTEDNVTRWHVLYRSDSLGSLTDEEWNYLYTNGIRTVVDLRSITETEQNKVVIPKKYPITYKKCPVQSIEVDLTSGEPSKFALNESMEKAYIEMFDDDTQLFTKALITIIESLKSGQTIFFCNAGKDRTGIIAGMLLYICKCYNEDIVSDYQISYTLNEEGINNFLKTLDSVKIDESKLKSQPENMKTLLQHFKDINLDKVLTKNGLSKQTKELLFQYFLEKN